MKVLLIDPWGTANTSEYLNGLIFGLSPITDLTVFTNAYFELKVDCNKAEINRIFFPRTEKMKSSIFRKLFRGIEYIHAYKIIMSYLKNQRSKFDVIHINWLLHYKLDKFNLSKIKPYCSRIVYTAHNVLPHSDGENYIEELRTIYGLCDKVVLHGDDIKKEFQKYYPEFVGKTFVQKHGCNLLPNTNYSIDSVDEHLKNTISSFKRVFCFFGIMFYNKGVDRLINIWDTEQKDALLVVAGRIDGQYAELNAVRNKALCAPNILLIDSYVNNNDLNYIIDKSCLVILPYRHASMSGVVFTAADFHKPILTTNVGSIGEYLTNNVNSFIVDNDDVLFKEKLLYILNEVDEETLKMMGNKLHDDIVNSCGWDIIAKNLVANCYL